MTNNYILQKKLLFLFLWKSFFLSPRRKFGKMLVKRKWMHSGWFCPQRFIINRVNFRFQDLYEAEFPGSICPSSNFFYTTSATIQLLNVINCHPHHYKFPKHSLPILYSSIVLAFFFISTIFHRISHTGLLQIVHYYWSGCIRIRKKWNASFYLCQG